jgi:hypothetical protein
MDYEKISSLPVWIKLIGSLIPVVGLVMAFTRAKWVRFVSALLVCVIALFLIWGVGKARSPQWWKLKVAVDGILESYTPVIQDRVSKSVKITPEQRLTWLRRVHDLLDSQIENPILLRNDNALAHWRAAQESTAAAIRFEEAFAARTVTIIPPDTEGSDQVSFWQFAEEIVTHVLAVWREEVWSSSEPGAPRRPKPNQMP